MSFELLVSPGGPFGLLRCESSSELKLRFSLKQESLLSWTLTGVVHFSVNAD